MSNDSKSGQGYPGQQGLTDATTDYNHFIFLIEQVLARVRTACLVEVMAVHVDGDVSPVGFVDAKPIVKMMDGSGKTFPHGTIFSLPYCRMQGGANAVICDPKPGDIGVAVICDRDISSVKANRGEAAPGSRRRFGLADGVYVCGALNAKPTCYVLIKDQNVTMTPDDGVTSIVMTPGKITFTAAEIVSHATTKNVFDANGTGFVYTAAQIDTYTDGVTTSHHPPTPPEVPT